MFRTFRKSIRENFFETFTTLMGVVGQGAVYIQAFKIFHLKSAYSISLTATLISAASMACWLNYGIVRRIWPLVIANAFGLIGASFVLWGIFCYGCG